MFLSFLDYKRTFRRCHPKNSEAIDYPAHLKNVFEHGSHPTGMLRGNVYVRSCVRCFVLNERHVQLLLRAAKVFQEEHFKNHNKAREEIEKRIRTLTKMKQIQTTELEKMLVEKNVMKNKAEALAEKYEDIKDRQEVFMARSGDVRNHFCACRIEDPFTFSGARNCWSPFPRDRPNLPRPKTTSCSS